MPKMYKIVSGGSYTWEYVDTDKNDEVLARSEESWAEEDDAEDAVYQMQNALLKRGKEEPRRARPKKKP